MHEICGAVSGIIQRPYADVLHFLFLFVVAVNETFVVRINDVPVARIRNDETAFTTAGLKPILTANHS
jgi:hypothetical protein